MANAADHVFGVDHQIHPVTKMPLETGVGALSIEQQAMLHIAEIHRMHGKEAADNMRAALNEHLHPTHLDEHGETDV